MDIYGFLIAGFLLTTGTLGDELLSVANRTPTPPRPSALRDEGRAWAVSAARCAGTAGRTMSDITRNDTAQRYELRDDDGTLVGLANFEDRDGRRVFTHTEVDDEREGKGFGSDLARGALDDTRAQGMRVVPVCPFISGWIDRHDDYAALVDVEMLDRVTS